MDVEKARGVIKEFQKFGITEDDWSRCLGLLEDLVEEVDKLRHENQIALKAVSASVEHSRYLERELYRGP